MQMMVHFPWLLIPNSLSIKAPSFENSLFPAVIQVVFWRDPFFQPMPMIIFQVGIPSKEIPEVQVAISWLLFIFIFPCHSWLWPHFVPRKTRALSISTSGWPSKEFFALCLSSLSSSSILCTGMPLVPRMRLVILPHFDAKPTSIASSCFSAQNPYQAKLWTTWSRTCIVSCF